MARLSPLLVLPLVVTAGFVALSFAGMKRTEPDQLPSMLEGHLIAPVTLSRLGDADAFTSANLQDDTVKIVNFWASWCAPCRAEHPNLKRLTQEGVTIYGVNYKDTATAALSFLESLGNPYRAIGADETGRMGIDWGLYGVPETFVIAPGGKVVLRFAGPITDRVLRDEIRPALAKAAGLR